MQAKGVAPEVIAYNSAIDACAKGGDWERALQLVEEMATRGVQGLHPALEHRAYVGQGSRRILASLTCSNHRHGSK